MQQDSAILKTAIETLQIEADAIRKSIDKVNTSFADCVKLILNSNGRVVITGIGKSAIIAQKIVATLNSTGTPSVFMHAADAIHGDLGIIQQNDVVICISKSGNTPEIRVLVPLLKKGGNKLIGLVGDLSSYLAVQSDFIMDCTVDKEACPNNLAPTTSTTVQLALGDALAVSLLKCRNFTAQDFAKYHPGGALGKRLYLKVKDVLSTMAPQVSSDALIKDVIIEITRKRLGATAVIDNNELVGVITDGDIRRMLEAELYRNDLTAAEIMHKQPRTIDEEEMAIDALGLMRENKVSQMIVLSKGTYKGMVHIHDLNREGII
ncbi:MAG: KpsF/GutQ family sugar-phosphate isomerase [Bacteroidia bacterium]|nr:KpsF/GutQ family sugar-phosphate isomerase [Bacteroidia bacterium]MBP7259956.1 KpsF/GutQ family sugar-phosphate isomerase [Bacteroidia bacterium]MBP9179416.1 KpsF/GutQ family sugar-phosphate isomerase [Bacteroidia bacterium]MBP9723695.1 KpsF/GutQ family sugar-phosphate isomerase [Bacteroidia bacterium]